MLNADYSVLDEDNEQTDTEALSADEPRGQFNNSRDNGQVAEKEAAEIIAYRNAARRELYEFGDINVDKPHIAFYFMFAIHLAFFFLIIKLDFLPNLLALPATILPTAVIIAWHIIFDKMSLKEAAAEYRDYLLMAAGFLVSVTVVLLIT